MRASREEVLEVSGGWPRFHSHLKIWSALTDFYRYETSPRKPNLGRTKKKDEFEPQSLLFSSATTFSGMGGSDFWSRLAGCC